MRCSVFLLVILVQFIRADDDDHWWSNTNKLHKDLLDKNKYSTKVNPQTGKNHTTEISMSISVRTLDIDDKTQTLTVTAWLTSHWLDRRLQWDPKEYGDLSSTNLGHDDVWKPDLTVYNSADPMAVDHYGKVPILAYPSGFVLWVPPMITKTRCPMDMTYFPFDSHTCKIYLGSWTEHGFQVDFIPYRPNATTEELSHAMIEINHHWTLTYLSLKRESKIYQCCPEPYIHLEMDITMKRSSQIFTYTVTIPAVAIALLILVQFVLPVDYPPRVTVGIAAAILTVMMLGLLSLSIPPLGDGIPLIVKYYGIILMLTIISIALSGILARLSNEEPQVLSIPPPLLIKTTLTGTVGTILLIRHYADKVSLSSSGSTDIEEEGLAARKSYQHEWLMVAAAVDRIMALTYCIALFCCCVSYV